VPRAPDASANFAQPWSFYVLKLSQPLHFGDDGGLPLQIIWALLDIASIIVLAWLMLGLVTAVCLRFAPGMPPGKRRGAACGVEFIRPRTRIKGVPMVWRTEVE